MHQNSTGAPLCLQGWQSPLLVCSSMGFWACRKTEFKNCLFAQMWMYKYKIIFKIWWYCITISVRFQMHKKPCLIYHPGRNLNAKNLPRRTGGSRRAQQLENTRSKGQPTLSLFRFSQPIGNSGVILAIRFWIQKDCVRSYFNSAFRTGEVVVGFGFN